MGHELYVPTVTPGELSAFHTRTFGSTAPSRSLPCGPNSSANGKRKRTEDAKGQDDDELGYYSDGIKRTLTNEQIAMFRHSEIYAILRERQVRKENREADEEDDVDMNQTINEHNEVIGEDEVYDPPDRQRKWMNTERMIENNHDYWKDPANIPWPSGEESITTVDAVWSRDAKAHDRGSTPSSRGEKRKGKHAKADDEVNRGRKARGIVRELDASIADEQVLDYGDEGPSNTDSVEEVTKEPPPEGKKIWWPVIGE